MPRPFVKAVALSGAVAASALFAFSANAAQVLTPKRSGIPIDTVSLPAGTTVPAGTTLFIDMDYSVTGSQTANEAGLGLKIGYDSSKFDPVITYDVNGIQTSTLVSNLHTKCMIASPSDQLVSGTTREVVFGWIDTSIRTTPTAGAVGWPGTADPAAPGTANGCLNPGGIVTESGAVAVPATLFRIGLKSKIGFTSGSTNVTVNTAGNISYANAGNLDTSKTILVVGAAAPTIALASTNPYVSRKTHGAVAYDIPINPAGLITGAPAASAVTVEPRVGSTANATTGHQIVVAFTGAAPTSVGSVVAQTQAAASVSSSVSYVGNEMIITLGSVPDGSRVSVTANAVNGVAGLNPSAVVCFLVGDVNSSWSTTGTDVNAVKSAAATSPAVTASNFKNDVNLTGGATGITGTDVNAVKAKAAASATCL